MVRKALTNTVAPLAFSCVSARSLFVYRSLVQAFVSLCCMFVSPSIVSLDTTTWPQLSEMSFVFVLRSHFRTEFHALVGVTIGCVWPTWAIARCCSTFANFGSFRKTGADAWPTPDQILNIRANLAQTRAKVGPTLPDLVTMGKARTDWPRYAQRKRQSTDSSSQRASEVCRDCVCSCSHDGLMSTVHVRAYVCFCKTWCLVGCLARLWNRADLDSNGVLDAEAPARMRRVRVRFGVCQIPGLPHLGSTERTRIAQGGQSLMLVLRPGRP